jgi:hypothetical protein
MWVIAILAKHHKGAYYEAIYPLPLYSQWNQRATKHSTRNLHAALKQPHLDGLCGLFAQAQMLVLKWASIQEVLE